MTDWHVNAFVSYFLNFQSVYQQLSEQQSFILTFKFKILFQRKYNKHDCCSNCRKDLGKLDYLTECIKEGMRAHSPVPGVSRVNTQPIKVDDVTIPPGTIILINFYALHHNPTVWGQDHMEFKPERFNRDNSEKKRFLRVLSILGGTQVCSLFILLFYIIFNTSLIDDSKVGHYYFNDGQISMYMNIINILLSWWKNMKI